MRVVRAAGQNVSPSDDGRLYDQIFSDGLFNEPTFTNLGGNNVQVSAIYGDLCGRDFTVEQMTLAVTLPDGEGETTGYIYVEIDTSSEDVITLNSALAPFTPTYEDINTNGAVAQMVLAEYTASAVAVTSVTPVYQKSVAGSIAAGSVATVENAQAVNAHSAGDYILLNSKLYIVTAAVAVGETFVEGTNITAKSIGGELKALNNGLTASKSRTLLGSGVPAPNTSYNLNESVNNFDYIEIIVCKANTSGGAFQNRIISRDNMAVGYPEALAISAYNSSSYRLHMECGFSTDTRFTIATYNCVGWSMSVVYVVGIGRR